MEFLGHFHKWLVARRVLHTRTPGGDPRANGRAEVSVQNVTVLRKTLYQAGVGSVFSKFNEKMNNPVSGS